MKKKVKVQEGVGDGVISALYQAIISATGLKGKLSEYKVNALTPESGAVGIAHTVWKPPMVGKFMRIMGIRMW